MKLSDTQRIILSQASQRDDRLAIPPERLPAAARQTVAKSLVKQELVSDEHASAYNARDAWQIDGRTRLLRITEAGLRAIGIEPEPVSVMDEAELGGLTPAEYEEEQALAQAALDAGTDLSPGATGEDEHAAVANTAPTGGEDAPPQDTPAANPEAALYPALPAEAALLDQALAARAATPRASLRDAAATLLAAWDDEANRDGDMIGALDAPMEALRILLAGKAARAPRDPGAPRKPREGTKQETVLAMLRRAEGATIAQICEATGWQQHTVRGFFAGLKKRQGITVIAAERIRQVGPNKEGARGSYTIYKIAG